MKTELPAIGQYELQQLLARTSTGEVSNASRYCITPTLYRFTTYTSNQPGAPTTQPR